MIHMTLDSVRSTQSSVVQIIHHSRRRRLRRYYHYICIFHLYFTR